FVLNNIPLAHSQEEPQKFLNVSEARKAGCRPVYLKSPKLQSCVVSTRGSNELHLGIYDRTPSGGFLLQQTFAITSWYLAATVDFPDLFGDGRRFMGVRFEGNTGTGVMQWVYLLVGWNQDHYEAALLESVDYQRAPPGFFSHFKMAMRIQKG